MDRSCRRNVRLASVGVRYGVPPALRTCSGAGLGGEGPGVSDLPNKGRALRGEAPRAPRSSAVQCSAAMAESPVAPKAPDSAASTRTRQATRGAPVSGTKKDRDAPGRCRPGGRACEWNKIVFV